MFGLRARVKLDGISDEMSKSTAGYSFVHDRANNLKDAYLALVDHACLSPVHGLMLSERWNMAAVDRYLRKVFDFLGLLSVCMHTLSGQSARGPEMLSVECENGPASLRGIFVHAGRMMYVTRHHKARRATNNEFQVARILPRQVGEVLFNYLVYMRPFVEMIRRRCLGQSMSSRLLFFNYKSEDGLWKSSQLSRSLREHAAGTLSTPLGIQTYRQISIAITERHIQALDGPFNRLDDKSDRAGAEVVFAWQSGHRPRQRVTNYGVDGAYPDTLQPALLRVYECASLCWHEFLGLDDHGSATISIPSATPPSNVTQERQRAVTDTTFHNAKRKHVEVDATDECYAPADSVNAAYLRPIRSESDLLFAGQNQIGTFNQHISYLTDYKVVVCVPCGHGIVPPPKAKRHFKDMHSAWPIAIRNQLVSCIDKLCLRAPEEVEIPKEPVLAIRGISVYDGWSCLKCAFCCVSELSMQEHARLIHGWMKGHGRRWRAAQVQTFFSGDKRRFFKVVTNES